MSILIGVIFHIVGGFCAGSFYLPLKKVSGWAWESYWIVNGVVAWLLLPLAVVAWLVPNVGLVFASTDAFDLLLPYCFGVLWGIGGVTFGLTMRYLGMALGMSLALGLTAIIGTLVPPAYSGELQAILGTTSGKITILGVSLILLGILVCGYAGYQRETSGETDNAADSGVVEFNLLRGSVVALIAGLMSACMAFGIAAGKPIAHTAMELGVNPIWQHIPVFVVIFLGGLTTNLLWCIRENLKNRTVGDYLNTDVNLARNYLLCAAAGAIWYGQFLFYGVGATFMGDYEFVGWSLHMGSIVIFSSIWGFVVGEWGGASRQTLAINLSGLAALIFAVSVIGYGSYLGLS